MRITDLNRPDRAEPRQAPPPEAGPGETRTDVEMALLRARVMHLEAVLETARGLMTSNQERLLRRLYEVPEEIAALSARLNGLGAGPETRPMRVAEG